jgi:hypothetical protein
MKLHLSETVASPQDLKELSYEIQAYAKWFTHASIKKKASNKSDDNQPLLSEATSNLLEQWFDGKTISRASLDELSSKLDDFYTSAPRMTITLAAPAPPSLQRSIVSWCRKEIKADVLVSFRFNASLLGGMVVSYGSHVFDWSFRRSLLANRQGFSEVLRRA